MLSITIPIWASSSSSLHSSSLTMSPRTSRWEEHQRRDRGFDEAFNIQLHLKAATKSPTRGSCPVVPLYKAEQARAWRVFTENSSPKRFRLLQATQFLNRHWNVPQYEYVPNHLNTQTRRSLAQPGKSPLTVTELEVTLMDLDGSRAARCPPLLQRTAPTPGKEEHRERLVSLRRTMAVLRARGQGCWGLNKLFRGSETQTGAFPHTRFMSAPGIDTRIRGRGSRAAAPRVPGAMEAQWR